MADNRDCPKDETAILIYDTYYGVLVAKWNKCVKQFDNGEGRGAPGAHAT